MQAREDLFFKNFELHQADEDSNQVEDGAMDPNAPRLGPGGPMQGMLPPMAFPMPMQVRACITCQLPSPLPCPSPQRAVLPDVVACCPCGQHRLR